MTDLTQRNATRNQSTADYGQRRIFLFNNRYQEGTFKNNTGAELVLKAGSLVKRDPANAAQVIPAANDKTLQDVVGIVKLDEDVTLAAGATLVINFAISGDIDETELALPAGASLDAFPTDGTTPLTITLRDILQAKGFVLQGSVQNTKYDN